MSARTYRDLGTAKTHFPWRLGAKPSEMLRCNFTGIVGGQIVGSLYLNNALGWASVGL